MKKRLFLFVTFILMGIQLWGDTVLETISGGFKIKHNDEIEITIVGYTTYRIEKESDKVKVFFSGTDQYIYFYLGNEKLSVSTKPLKQNISINTGSFEISANDNLSSETEVLDETLTTVWKSGYDAFGEVAGVEKTTFEISFNGFYTGKDIDPETGLTYHWNRWRSEDGSVWLTQDPARDGYNWYAYCSNNPLIFVDPNGLETAGYNNKQGSYDLLPKLQGIDTGNKWYNNLFDGFVSYGLEGTYNLAASFVNTFSNGIGAISEIYDIGINKLDEIIPSKLTASGSFKQDMDALAFISLTNPRLMVNLGESASNIVSSLKLSNQNARVARNIQRREQLIKDNIGYNATPENVFNTYDTIGKNGTFVTDKKAFTDAIGNFEVGKQKLSRFQTRKLEKALGLERGSLKEGFRITEIQNIQDLNPRIPTSGNKYFRPGEGLPGGGPELIVDPVSTGRK